MTEKEIQQELERMRTAGLRPMLCDVAVPMADVPVMAGYPAEAGDATANRYVLLPHQLVGRHPMFLIEAEGDSMQNVGIMAGDTLEVQMDMQVADGEVVVAEVDGAYTVKTFYTDDEGTQWLVPENDNYDPILLTGHIWRIVGKVTGLRRGKPQSSFSTCAKAVMRLRRKTAEGSDMANSKAFDNQPRNLVFKQFVNRQRIDFAAVRSQVERVVLKQMRHHYEWYAAYRVLLDMGLLEELQLTKFAQQMQVWFPQAPIACKADSLGDYAVGHTSKAFTLWNIDVFRQELRRGQSVTGFNVLYHRCEELRATLFPLPTLDLALPF
ncbi:MAG: hypothetical protein J5552_06790 [Prevotella sp.]|nr:hypothetical protein [Prevotella sp.]